MFRYVSEVQGENNGRNEWKNEAFDPKAKLISEELNHNPRHSFNPLIQDRLTVGGRVGYNRLISLLLTCMHKEGINSGLQSQV